MNPKHWQICFIHDAPYVGTCPDCDAEIAKHKEWEDPIRAARGIITAVGMSLGIMVLAAVLCWCYLTLSVKV